MKIFNLRKLSQNDDKVEQGALIPQINNQPLQPSQDAQTDRPSKVRDEIVKQPQTPSTIVPQQDARVIKKPINIIGQDFSMGWPMLQVELQQINPQQFNILQNFPKNFLLYAKKNNNGVAPNYAIINKKESTDRIMRCSYSDGVATIFIALELSFLMQKFIEQLEKTVFNYDTSEIKRYLQTNETVQSASYYIISKSRYTNPNKNTERYANVISLQVVSDDLLFVPQQTKSKVASIIKQFIDISHELSRNSSVFDATENAWLFFIPNADVSNTINVLRQMADKLQENNFDVSQFVRKLDDFEAEKEGKIDEEDVDPNKIIVAQNVYDTKKFHIGIEMNYGEVDEQLQETIQTFFPTRGVAADLRKSEEDAAEKPEGMHLLSIEGFHYIYGDSNQYALFIARLRKTGWDVGDLPLIVSQLYGENAIESKRINGQLEGYEKRTARGAVRYDDKTGLPLVDIKKFDDAAKTASTASLYEAQVEGVRYLYQNSSAILGDKTGTGKTLQTLIAAKLRAEQENKPVLIFTLKSVVLQWANEIRYKLQEPPDKLLVCDASLDPNIYGGDFVVSPIPTVDQLQNVKYVLLSYPRMTAKLLKDEDGVIRTNAEGLPLVAAKRKSVEQILHAILQTNFAAVIMDEAHTIKNPKAAISQILDIISKKIEFKWAASATTIANTPIDILNVLKLNGHILGNLGKDEFMSRYVGPQLKISHFKQGIAENVTRQRIERAQKLKAALITSGGYISRTKEEIRPDMPPHDIEREDLDDSEAGFDMEGFVAAVEDLKAKYGENPLPLLTTQRRMIAERKVSATVKKAIELYEAEQNKILIFSNFVDVCKSIAANLRSYIAANLDEFQNFQVLEIIGDTNLADLNGRVKSFKEDYNSIFMVVSAKKGGTGISLEDTATHVIMNDFDWSPSIVEQTEGRAYRITNTQAVKTHYMVLHKKTEDGQRAEFRNPDEIWYDYLRTKIKIAQQIQNLQSKENQEIASGISNLTTTEELTRLSLQDAEAEISVREEMDQTMIANGGSSLFGEDAELGAGTRVIEQLDEINDLGIDIDNDPNAAEQFIRNRELAEGGDDENNVRRASSKIGWYKKLN